MDAKGASDAETADSTVTDDRELPRDIVEMVALYKLQGLQARAGWQTDEPIRSLRTYMQGIARWTSLYEPVRICTTGGKLRVQWITTETTEQGPWKPL